MTKDERLDKKISAASRIAAAIANVEAPSGIITRAGSDSIARQSLMIAESIITYAEQEANK